MSLITENERKKLRRRKRISRKQNEWQEREKLCDTELQGTN